MPGLLGNGYNQTISEVTVTATRGVRMSAVQLPKKLNGYLDDLAIRVRRIAVSSALAASRQPTAWWAHPLPRLDCWERCVVG